MHGLTCFINEMETLASLTAPRPVSDFVLFALQSRMSKDWLMQSKKLYFL